MKSLTPTQIRILDFISEWQRENGHPPTQAEIGKHFGFKSITTVRDHLRLIEKKGFIRLNAGKARGIQIVSETVPDIQQRDNSIPILGRIAAGVPLWAEQNHEGSLPVSPAIFGGGELFALHVVGDSMTGVGINNGDLAVIKKTERVENGEIAVVLVEQEATLKRVFRSTHQLVLKSENPIFKDLRYDLRKHESIRILGRYQGIIRTMNKQPHS